MDLDVKYHHTDSLGHVHLLSEYDIEEMLAKKYGQRFRDYRERWKRACQMEAVEDFPLSIEFETSNTCNFTCGMCIYADKTHLHPDYRDQRPKGYMDINLYKSVIDEATDHGMPAATYGFWCEPLLHPQIVDMIAYGHDHGLIDMRLGTNGQLLTASVSKGLIDAGLQRLEVSVDACAEETFKKIRRGGDFQKVVRNIHEFLEIRDKLGVRFPLLRISFVKLDANVHELDDFIAYWKTYADYFSIQAPHDFFGTHPDVESKFTYESPREKPDFKCSKSTHRLWMRCNGNGQSCGYPAAWEAFTLGTFPTDSISKMWRHETQGMLRSLHGEGRYADHPICHKCALYMTISDD